MARAPDETSATFDDLQRFLGEPGCALCRQEAQSEHRYFETLLYEDVTTPATTAALRASDGFCRRHAEALLDRRLPLATAILYGNVLLERHHRLARWRQGRRGARPGPGARRAAGPCPACAAEQQGVRRAAEVLAAGLERGPLRQAWAASAGLCWPHFLDVRARCRAGRAVLDQIQDERMGALAADLKALVDSFDYRHDSGRTPQVEAAWRNAVAALAGRVRGGRDRDAAPGAGRPPGARDPG